jgi:acetoin utilization deacetylase AcuC-like enzyme
MTTFLFTHPSAQQHDTGPGHPEHAGRIAAVLAALDGPAFAALHRREAPPAAREALHLVHHAAYVEDLLAAVPSEGLARIDADTVLSPASGEAALHGAGAVVAAVDAVLGGDAANAFCAVRPPGHHAEPGRGMGFCLFNNVAIGAAHARAAHGLDRVAIVDFDVHHGNGTQAAFAAEPSVLFASTHEYPLYPGTGAADERGVGNIFNAPLAPRSGSAEFRAAMQGVILPALREFAPELILISAGFDAHRDDPLATLRFETADYAWVTGVLGDIAAAFCAGRMVATLEGGYDLDALGACVAAHVGALMGH